MKKLNLLSVSFTALIGIAAGVLLLALHSDFIFNLMAIFLGLGGIIVALPPFLDSLKRNGEEGSVSGIILYGLILAVSLGLMIWRNFVVMIVLGLCFILAPVVRIVNAKDNISQLKEEFPRILVGLVLILMGPCRVVDWLFRFAGYAIILLSVLYFIVGLFKYMKLTDRAESRTKGTRTFWDTTGDGNVDTIHVDTTGDGKNDTEIPYNKN